MSEQVNERRLAKAKQKSERVPSPHRQLPASGEAEQGVICSFLIAAKEIGALLAEMGVTSDWFHSPAIGTIYGVLMEAWEANKPMDVVTLTETLHGRGILEQVGGPAFVSELFTYLPTAANAEYYVTILKEKMALRKVIQVGCEYASRAYEEQSEVWDIVDGFEMAALKVRPDRSQKVIQGPKKAVMEAMTSIAEAYENRGSILGMSTGFAELDKLTDGMHRQEIIIIAARPSNGKTALAMNIAEHVAINLKLPVGIFSLEMSETQLIKRLLLSRAKVNFSRVREGFLSERDFPAMTAAATDIAEAPIYIDDTGGISIQELRARARRMKQKFDIQALFVDYLQLLRSESKKSQDNRQLEVSECSAGLKALAKELNIPIVVLCQIARSVEQRGAGSRPRLSDLRESGSIEQDADVVAFITRPELMIDDPEERLKFYGVADLIIAKQRSGPIGDVPLTFLKEFTRFETRVGSETDRYDEEQQPQQQSHDEEQQKRLI